MNKALIGFAIGLTTGSLVTLAIVDKKYRKIADEEIESVREYYKNRDKASGEVTVKANMAKMFDVVAEDIRPDMEFPKIPEEEYKKIVDELGYTKEEMEETLNDPDISVSENENGEHEIFVEPVNGTRPYVISPEDYGEFDYDTKEWTYYADFVLADEEGEIISNPENIIGDALEHFGEYEDGAVHVRNDDAECDYEIIQHRKTFSEIYGRDN